MPAPLYVVLRYGAISIVAVWLGAIGTSWLRVLAFGLVMTAIIAITANRRVADVKVPVAMAFLFELPGAALATCLGWAIGALALRH